jgi:bifunctional UDP-N-acetylglucosamine pyrophosphorylase/glucosamine-1-phosphate N-acetyltransferase
MKALVLTGGAGRTLVPFSATRPKSMTVVAGGSLLRRTLQHLREAGITDVTIVLGQNGSVVENAFGDGSSLGIHLSYVRQERPQGIADAILCARGKFMPGESFVLVYGDVVTSGNPFLQLLQSFNTFKSPIAGVCLPGPPTGRYGNVYLSGTRITKIVEKPQRPGLGNYVLSGFFILPTDLFSWLEECGKDMERVFERLTTGVGIHASIWEEGWIDVEFPWDVLAANRMVMDTWEEARISRDAKLDTNVTIVGPVRIEAGSVVRAGAVLAGPCYIGRDCYVGNNVLVRSYSSLGPGSTIGYGVELKNCVLFGGARIGRLSFVGDSVVGEQVDIGSGTMTVNETMDRSPIAVNIRGTMVESGLTKLGAFIGDRAKIGAGNTLAPGTVIEAGTIVPHHFTVPNPR